ncbi:MAG: hypothetical protein Q7U04_09095, partial [Bacteriovorax sp.]|nr:hypothetical protein [Bacteriovorax sp.]
MKFRLKKYPIFLLVFLQLITFPAVADESCFTIIKKILGSIDQNISTSIDLNEHINQRIFIGNYAKKNNIPVFYKQNHAGEEIPFILVNRDSSKKLSHLIENSFGTDVTLQPKRNNDHGLLRAGNFIIDLDLPGLRGYGEINKTGLAWKNFSSYTEKRQFDADVILEIAYLVTPEEKKIIDFYQRIRRAAIFRVRFVLNNFKTEEQPFLLNTGNEHCFIFCKGQAVAGHIAELREKLAELGLKNIDDF